MKNAKNKLNDYKGAIILNDEQEEIRRFCITVVVLTIIVLIVFLFTKYVINDGDINIVVFDSVTGQVNYNIASVGTMLDKEDKEYYVYIYSSEDKNVPMYQGPAAKYTSQEVDGILAIYYVDTNSVFNKNYLAAEGKEENIDAISIEELSLGELTLIKVKNGKIVKYLNAFDDIQKELSVEE